MRGALTCSLNYEIFPMVKKNPLTTLLELIKKKPYWLGSAALLIFVLFLYWALWGRFMESTDNAYVGGDITPLSPKVSGYVSRIFFDDGKIVKSEDALIKVEDKDYKEYLNKARSEVEATKFDLRQAEVKLKISTLEIPKANSKLKSAQAELEKASKTYNRSQKLLERKFASEEKNDAVKNDYINAQSELKNAQLQLEIASLNQQTAQLEKNKLTQTLKAKEASFNLAKHDVQNTTIKAPVAGIIGQRSCKVGQYVKPGTTLMYVVPLNNLWVIGNFKETQVARMKPGQKVVVKIDAFPGKEFEGVVEALAPATGAEFSLLPPDNATGNFTKVVQRVPVKIMLKNTHNCRVAPGMSAVLKINTRS